MGMLDNEIYSLLIDADNRWKKYVGRDDRKKRLLNIIDRARQKHPVGNDELTFRGLLESTGSHEEIEVNTKLIYGLQDFLDSEVEVEWLIEDLLERGGFGMVAGKLGYRFSWLASGATIEGCVFVPRDVTFSPQEISEYYIFRLRDRAEKYFAGQSKGHPFGGSPDPIFQTCLDLFREFVERYPTRLSYSRFVQQVAQEIRRRNSLRIESDIDPDPEQIRYSFLVHPPQSERERR